MVGKDRQDGHRDGPHADGRQPWSVSGQQIGCEAVAAFTFGTIQRRIGAGEQTLDLIADAVIGEADRYRQMHGAALDLASFLLHGETQFLRGGHAAFASRTLSIQPLAFGL